MISESVYFADAADAKAAITYYPFAILVVELPSEYFVVLVVSMISGPPYGHTITSAFKAAAIKRQILSKNALKR